MDQKDIVSDAIRRAEQKGPDYTVWQSKQRDNTLFIARQGITVSQAKKIWPTK